MNKLSTLAALGLCLGTQSTVAADASWPAKPIRIIVPFPPGGIADVMARVFAQKFTDSWGQQAVVDNRTGAGGNIGTEAVAKSPNDGYTLLLGAIGTHAVNVSLFSKIGYDPVRDFAPIALILKSDNLLVVHPSLPVKTVKEMIALAKAKPGQLTYASAGSGTAGHLAGELFKLIAKVDIVHIPYKGNVPAITDLIGGQTSMTFATLPTVLPQVQANRLRAIASTGTRRNNATPDTPTVAETLPSFEVTNWIAMSAPAGTAPEIVNKVNAEIMRVMRLPEVSSRLAAEGANFTPNTPAEFTAFQKAEIAKWAKVIKEAGVRAD